MVVDADVLSIESGDLRVEVLTCGATLVGVWCPDAAGRVANVALRHADLGAYRDPDRNPYLGSMVGRYANRIARGRFTLDGVEYQVSANEGTTCLHGGVEGWSFRTWDVLDTTTDRVVLGIVSPDGDQGFPGQIHAEVTYRLNGWTLHIDAQATTTASTPLSMTNHAYWNLAGHGAIDDHALTVNAERIVEVDELLLPTGATRQVVDTPFDLRDGAEMGTRHIDRCYWPTQPLGPIGLSHRNGRSLTLGTDQPSIQVYTGDGLAAPFGSRGGICLEPQQLPDAPNQPSFPSPIVLPGDTYEWHATYEFSPTSGLLAG